MRSPRRAGPGLALLVAFGAMPGSVRGQDPDSTGVLTLPDSLEPGVSVVALDSGVVVDTVVTVHPDSVFRPLPGLVSGAPARPESGVTVWDLEALLGTPALTLLELLSREPDLLPLRYGDYGAPEAVVGPGAAGGRIRVLVDGFEQTPLTGAVTDLSRVSLAGIQEVRVERGGGEIRIELTSLEPFDSRPMSRVEAGTGDLDTNLFRGTFLHPRALGGTVGLSMERNDTQGRGGNEPGSRQGVWFRYAVHRGDDLALAFDLRKSTTEVALDSIPASLDRTTWTVRARARLAEGLVAEAFTGSANLTADDDGLTPVDRRQRQHGARLSFDRPLGARPAPVDTAEAVVVDPTAADTVAADTTAADTVMVPPAVADTTAVDPAVADSVVAEPAATPAPPPPPPPPVMVADGRLWALAEGRLFSGDLPSRSLVAEAGLDWNALGGVAVELRSGAWADPVRDLSATTRGVRAWTAPVFGVSLFAGWDSGVRGSSMESARILVPEPDTTAVDTLPPVPDTLPDFHLSDRTALRAGARVALGPLDVVGAWHRVDLDSILPVEILGTRAGEAVPGQEVTGYEVSGRLGLPILFDGLALTGSLMQWETGGFYRPRRRYTGGLDFHDVFKNGNLEFWTSLQVQGRDGMVLPWPETVDDQVVYPVVPFHQSWDFWLQVRVQTVRIFIRTENVTLRRSNQDFPDRLLLQTRSVYGVRWTLWN